MALKLPQRFVDEMIAHAREDLPEEACGLIAGVDGRATKLYRIRNAAEDGYRGRRYVMDGLELDKRLREMDADGSEINVIYHSHVQHDAVPSRTDIRMAYWPQSDPPVEIFPDVYYVLVSMRDREHPVVRAFKILDKKAVEEPLEIEAPA